MSFSSITVRKDEFLHNDETLNILWSPIHAVWEGDVIGLGSKRSECIVLQELEKSSQETRNIRLRSQEMEKLDYYPLKWYDESDLKKNELVHSFKVCKPNRSCWIMLATKDCFHKWWQRRLKLNRWYNMKFVIFSKLQIIWLWWSCSTMMNIIWSDS